MQLNYFSVTFWFNIYQKHNEILNLFQENFKEEYNSFSVFNYTDNLVAPIIRGVSSHKKTNISFSQINLQYTMDDISLDNFKEIKENTQKIFEFLVSNNIQVSHTSLYLNGELIDDDALNVITNNTISNTIKSDDLVDISLKLGKKHEDLFYKIINILNKKKLKIPETIDDSNRLQPIPLISWHDAKIENEIIEFSYEINDKYSFDFTKNYHTTDFYLNKMLYILTNDFQDELNNLINGKF